MAPIRAPKPIGESIALSQRIAVNEKSRLKGIFSATEMNGPRMCRGPINTCLPRIVPIQRAIEE